jgi:nitrogen fixation/metabolism regulation signal transduction histidine kinase
MTKSELKELIRETILTEMEGYSKYFPGGKTSKLDTKTLNTILTNLAKSAKEVDVEKEETMDNNEDKVVSYIWLDDPNGSDTPVKTRVYKNNKTGELYVKQAGDGVGED